MPSMSTAEFALPRPGPRDPLAVFLFFSLLLHLLLFLFFPLLERDGPTPPQEQLTEVELLPPLPATPPQIAQAPAPTAPLEPKAPEKPLEEKSPEKPRERLPEQIVSPPDQTNEEVPEKTRFLSDRNSATKEESVAVGSPRPAPPQKEKTPPKEKVETPKPPVQLAQKTAPIKPPREKPLDKSLSEATTPRSPTPGAPDAPKRSPQLFVRPDDLLAQGWLSDDGSDQDTHAERQPPQGRDIIALAPPPARENPFSLPGPLGVPDYLPDIRQGNLTFLNTKAHRFAPFVRRVALRVFQHLIIHQRKQLQVDDVIAAREMVMIQAKLDVKGNLKGLILQTRSGSYSVDESLLKACEQGAWDENPPVEAQAEDGFIHFIFRSDINAQYDDLGLRAIITYLQVGLV